MFLTSVLLVLAVIFVFVLLIGGYGIGIYNHLVALRNDYKNQFAQIDVQLKRRHDLIPNLVETAKGYMAHERGTLDEVTAARTSAVAARQQAAADPAAVPKVAAAENALTQSLGRLFAVAEAYPDLKANQTMLALQSELTETENRISLAREAYNESVVTTTRSARSSPTACSRAPSIWPASLYEITDPGDPEVPKVSFT